MQTTIDRGALRPDFLKTTVDANGTSSFSWMEPVATPQNGAGIFGTTIILSAIALATLTFWFSIIGFIIFCAGFYFITKALLFKKTTVLINPQTGFFWGKNQHLTREEIKSVRVQQVSNRHFIYLELMNYSTVRITGYLNLSQIKLLESSFMNAYNPRKSV